jgi:hypothetical protein
VSLASLPPPERPVVAPTRRRAVPLQVIEMPYETARNLDERPAYIKAHSHPALAASHQVCCEADAHHTPRGAGVHGGRSPERRPW